MAPCPFFVALPSVIYNLCSNALCDGGASLNDVLQDFCCIIKYIRKSPLRSRMFQGSQARMASEDQATDAQATLKLIYYCEVRWLSRGLTGDKFYSLYEVIVIFLKKQKLPPKAATIFQRIKSLM